MDEQYQISVIQFYEGERQNFSSEQLESANTSPIKQSSYQQEQENLYKIKYEEMINILDEKENEISSLQEQLSKSGNEKDQLQKQFQEHFLLFEQKQDECIIKEKMFFDLTQEKSEILSKVQNFITNLFYQYSQDPNKSLLQLFQEKEKLMTQQTISNEQLIKLKDNQIKELQEQNSLLQLQYDKSEQNYQNQKNKYESLQEMSEQIEKNKAAQEEQKKYLDKQQQLIQTKLAESQDQLSHSKDLNLKYEIEISSLKKQLEISAQQLNEMVEQNQLEITKLKQQFDNEEKIIEGAEPNISQKPLGSEFSELLDKLEKKQNLEKSAEEAKFEEMQEMFTQQDLLHLKKECEAKLEMCIQLSSLNEAMKNKNKILKQQLLLSKHDIKQVEEKLEKVQNEQKIILEQIDLESTEKNKMQSEIKILQEKCTELENQLKQQVSQEQYRHLLDEMKKKDKFLEIQKGLLCSQQNPDQLDEEIKLYSSLLYGLKEKLSQTNLLI